MAKTTKPIPRVWKGSETFEHDLYCLEIATCLRNHSYKKGSPEFEKVEHKHFFHSVDRKGKPLTRSTISGDHFHDVKITKDKNGDILSMECGPAQQVVEKTLKIGDEGFTKRVKKVESPSWVSFKNDTVENVVDEHVHEISYVRTETLSPGKLVASQQADGMKLAQLMAKLSSQPAQGPTNAQASNNEDLG